MRVASLPASKYKWWAMGALSLGIIAGVVDQNAANIALPTIADYFGTDLPAVQWVYLGYTVTISALLLPAGRLSDMFGRKRMYLAGLSLVALGSALAAASPTLWFLVLVKLLSGAGLGLVYANNMAIITAIFPGKERGQGLGLMSLCVGTGSVAAPVVGGVLVTGVGWRSVFVFGVALTLAAVTAGMLIFKEERISPPKRSDGPKQFDWAGSALSALTLIVALLALTNANKLGWASPFISGGLALALVLGAAFVVWELRYPAAMFDLRLFKRKAYTLAITARLMIFLGTTAAFFLMPFYLQGALGYSAQNAGLILMASSVLVAVAGPFSGKLSDRFGYRPFMIVGMLLSIAGMLILGLLTVNSPLWVVVVGLVLQGAGSGIFISPNLSCIFGSVEREKHSITTSFMNLVRNTANAAATAIAVAIVSAAMLSRGFEPKISAAGVSAPGAAAAFTVGMRYAFLGLGACLLIGLVATLVRAKPPEADEAQPSVAEAAPTTASKR